MVVGVLTCCALFHYMCNLKATQMNVQCGLIWELMLYKFKLGYRAAEVTKKICAKCEGAVDHSAVTRQLKKFCLGYKNLNNQACPVRWGCRIHWLHLCRGVRLPPYECPGYDTKQSDGEVPAILELWGMQSTPLLPSLPGPPWPGMVAPNRALSIG